MCEMIDDIIDYNTIDEKIDNTDLDGPIDTLDLTFSDKMINDSRLAPNGNGTHVMSDEPPTNSQKWWAAIVIGFVFALISSPAAYFVTSTVTTSLGGAPLVFGPGPNLVGLLVHTIIFILIVRLILW